MALKVGDKAPAFKLYASDKTEVSLDDFKGKKVVLLFFPLAYTGVCTNEMCSTSEDLDKYKALDAEVLGISVDSFATLARFKQDYKINFPLLSDFNKEVARAYDALYEEFVLGMKGVARRSAFVIDREGVIRYAEVLESAGDLPNFEAIKQTLSEID
ncbi:MAG: redoxin domain-containing protein [Saprospiraceae bacterium]|nr:peroxiredoxin [Saprospirales bacterium]